MSIKRKKADHRADTSGKPWAGIPHIVLNSTAYVHCDLWERAILVELVRGMNGYNNGSIALSQRAIAARLRTSNFRRIGRSIAGLMQKGFIDVAIEGQWKERRAREYRLTFVNTGSNGRYQPATNEYRDWRPAGKCGVEPVSAEGPDSADDVSAEASPVARPPSAALKRIRQNRSGTLLPHSHHLYTPYIAAPPIGWWNRDVQLRAQRAILGLFCLQHEPSDDETRAPTKRIGFEPHHARARQQ